MKTAHLLAVIGLVTSSSFAGAPDYAFWQLDVSTEGEDIYWASPDTVRTSGATYRSTFTIVEVSVNVSWSGLEFGPFNVTDQIDPDDLVEQSEVAGPCPVDFGSSSVLEPPPPDPVTVAFDVFLNLSDQGQGIYQMNNIILGTTVYELPWPIGEVTVQLEEVFLRGNFEVEVIDTYCVADIDGDGSVGVNDLLAVIADWGCSGCDTDISGDGDVGVDDLLELIAAWGSCA